MTKGKNGDIIYEESSSSNSSSSNRSSSSSKSNNASGLLESENKRIFESCLQKSSFGTAEPAFICPWTGGLYLR